MKIISLTGLVLLIISQMNRPDLTGRTSFLPYKTPTLYTMNSPGDSLKKDSLSAKWIYHYDKEKPPVLKYEQLEDTRKKTLLKQHMYKKTLPDVGS